MGNSNSMVENESKIYEVPENLLTEEKLKNDKEKLVKTENVIKKAEDECANREEVVEGTIEPIQMPTLFHIIQAPRLI